MADERKVLAIGIDLGTTYSRVAVWHDDDDDIKIINDDEGNRTTPSAVAFTDSGILIGDAAKKQVVMNPRNTVYDTRRLIGRKFSDTCVQNDMKLWPFEVTSSAGEKPMIVVSHKDEEKQVSAEEISAMVLFKLKKIAEAFLDSTVKNVVVTVPAYFNDSQITATKVAGILAGFKIVHIINEPIAVAVALIAKLHNEAISEKNVLVFDLGGGTLDVSLLRMEEGVFDEVKSTTGDNRLGGEDFDNRMVNHFIREFKRKHHKDISMDATSLRRLKVHCEKAKRKLSFDAETTIEIESLYEGIDFYCTITRDEFEELNIDLFQKCISHVEECLSYAKMKKSDVHEVVLVGGSTWIPKVQQLLQDFFNGKDLFKSIINPDEVVAYGAAVHAFAMSYEGNKKFQDKVLENFCNRIIEDHEKLEAKSALEIYVYDMMNTVKKFEHVIDEASSWLHANKLRKADSFEYMMNDVESAITEMYRNDVACWGMDESDKKKLEAKKELEIFIEAIWDLMRDKRSLEKLSVIDKKNIEDAIDEVVSWLHKYPFEEVNEYEYKLEKLRRICIPLLSNMPEGVAFDHHELNLKMKNIFETYLYNMRNVVKDENIGEKFSLRDKNKIEDAIDESIKWLDANQESDEFYGKLNEIESVCNPIIVKMYQGGAFAESWWMEKEYMKNLEAKNALENYTYNMENSVKDEKIWEKLGGNNKEKIEDAIDETICLLDANQLAEADEFEYKFKVLKSVCDDFL